MTTPEPSFPIVHPPGQTPWWVVYSAPNGGAGGLATATYVQSNTAPKVTGDVMAVFGPYATKAAAQAAYSNGPSGSKSTTKTPLQQVTSGNWSLALGNTSGLLVRSLKVIIGGLLILSGIIRLTGADKAALGVAGKAAVFA